MMKLLKRILVTMLISSLIFSVLVGCGSNDSDKGSELPALPPDSSMSMDFSTFDAGKLAPSLPIPGKNYMNAAARVLAVDAAVITALAPSVTVFKAAKNATPVSQDDGSYVWKYQIAYMGNEYKAELTGSVEGDKSLWSMKITCPTIQPSLTDFEWYTGECASNNTSGTWRYFDYKYPDEAKENGNIEWSVSAIKESEVVFTSKNANSEIFGDILTYSLEGTTADMKYYDSSEDITADINWDIITGAGSIQVPKYNSGERAYWNENRQDVAQ